MTVLFVFLSADVQIICEQTVTKGISTNQASGLAVLSTLAQQSCYWRVLVRRPSINSRLSVTAAWLNFKSTILTNFLFTNKK